MHNVFISYTKHDRLSAYKIVEYLEANGIMCYIAPRNIDAGLPYASNITQAIDNCTIVLLIGSSHVNDSVHVLNELDIATNKKKKIVSVFIEEYELNDDFRYYIGRTQHLFAFEGDFEDYFPSIKESVKKNIFSPSFVQPETSIEKPSINQSTKKIFEYNLVRGIMINPEDHQRNVSFRTDTFINMLGGIYEKVAKLSSAEISENIFYESGLTSGQNFGNRINNQWNAGYSFEAIKMKLNKWCAFDSEVGWGKFEIQVECDERDNCIYGKLNITEGFIIDRQKKRKVCGFLKGYCTGVLEALLETENVSLQCIKCPLQEKFFDTCVFEFKASL